MARLVRLALPTSATLSSTTMTFACKDAPGGRALSGPVQAERAEAREGRAQRRVGRVVLVAFGEQRDRYAARDGGRQCRADRRARCGSRS